MTGQNDGKNIAYFLYCSSLLEEKTYQLYRSLADRTTPPLVKSMLLHIAHDSQKHSAILKGISDSIAKTEKKPKDCEKKLGENWKIILNLSKEITRKGHLPDEQMFPWIDKLTLLESTFGEEYYVLVQAKTLQYMTKEIKASYDIDLASIRRILASIIRDEETHMELLEDIKEIYAKRKEKKADHAPVVRYQSPDSWTKTMPSTA